MLRSTVVAGLRRFALGLGVLLTVHTPAEAQPRPTSPTELAQLIDVVLQALIPPDSSLSTLSVAARGIRFDFVRTIAAFELPAPTDADASLPLATRVAPGTQALLLDCNQMGGGSCAALGQAVLVWLSPIARTDTSAMVWLHLSYATTFPASGTQPTRSYLSGSSAEVYLRRSRGGRWTFVRTGKAIVG